eukprot:TRINITY_DN7276_c1_g3_i6.p1 TRINITY_DN7276_c1_g3~~TRINITY_DN7276_c1_g3_i6.p1  ORF type:complete len:279 (-),score=61.72 TRINITY_DN7276_c1_g3_i6:1115-1951(-)
MLLFWPFVMNHSLFLFFLVVFHLGFKPMEQMVSTTCSRPLMEKKARPPKEQALNCPRCNSVNTKFCYYNNYSLTQPRYFCKTCRRYWTEGGSLRNVPVGGGTRKNKRPSSSSANSKKTSDLTSPSSSLPSSQNPKFHQGQDLNLAYRTTNGFHNLSGFAQLPSSENHHNPSSTSSFSELLRSGISSRGLESFMPMPVLDPNSEYPSGFGLHDLRPTVNFPVEGLVGGYGSIQGLNEGGGKLLFPLEDVKQVSSNNFEQHRGQGETSGYWNGMLGGGSW